MNAPFDVLDTLAGPMQRALKKRGDTRSEFRHCDQPPVLSLLGVRELIQKHALHYGDCLYHRKRDLGTMVARELLEVCGLWLLTGPIGPTSSLCR